MLQPKKIEDLKIEEVVARVESLNAGLKVFWSKSDGWAPIEAAVLVDGQGEIHTVELPS